MYFNVRCKKCRNLIFSEEECKLLFLNSHNVTLNPLTEAECSIDNIVFLNEDSLPEWVKTRIEEESWSKGRINCQQCDSRIGAFNFIAGQKCDCSKFMLPFVHIIKSKVDLIKH
jgi:E3 ubiquitin-protein ligase RNF180